MSRSIPAVKETDGLQVHADAILLMAAVKFLTDDVALEWLPVWDKRNAPPKGEQRLQEILISSHHYGRRPYGCGLVYAGQGGDGK